VEPQVETQAAQATESGLAVANALTPESLQAIVRGEVDIVRDPAFHPPELCREAMPDIREALEQASYTLTADLQSIGTSVGEAAESIENAARYYDTALATAGRIRDSLFRNRPSPLDRLRIQLDEFWPEGAMVAHFDGRPMLSGIVRRWPSGGHANPHIDQSELDVVRHLNLTRRIGTNVYLEVPPAGAGGDLEFWHRIEDEATYAEMKRQDYGLDRAQLGEPSLRLRPEQGDLYMFDASIIHGVARVTRGERATAACFIGYVSDDQPLVIFA
jgi:hypothetical protein